MYTAEASTPAEQRPPTTPERPFGAVVVGALFVVAGGLWLLDATGVIELRFALVLPSALAVIGIALIVGSFSGPHRGLVVAGVFLTIATLVVALVPAGFSGGVGEREVRVAQQSDLETNYGLALGNLTLDLGNLDMTQSADVSVSVGAGEIRIILPAGIPVRIEASVGAGEIDLLGERADGLAPGLTHTGEGYDSAQVTLTLDVNVGAGKIEVRR